MINNIDDLINTINKIVEEYYVEHSARLQIRKRDKSIHTFITEYILYAKYSIITTHYKLIILNQNFDSSNYKILREAIKRSSSMISQDIKNIEEKLNKIIENNIQPAEQNVLFGFIFYTIIDYYKNDNLKKYNINRLFEEEAFLLQYISYFTIETYCGIFDRLVQLNKYLRQDITEKELLKSYTTFKNKIKNKKYKNYLLYNELLDIFKNSNYKEYFNHIDYI